MHSRQDSPSHLSSSSHVFLRQLLVVGWVVADWVGSHHHCCRSPTHGLKNCSNAMCGVLKTYLVCVDRIPLCLVEKSLGGSLRKLFSFSPGNKVSVEIPLILGFGSKVGH